MCFRTNLISRGIALLGVPAKSEPGSTWTTFFFFPFSVCVSSLWSPGKEHAVWTWHRVDVLRLVSPLLLFLFMSVFLSLAVYLSASDPSTPRVPKLVNQQIVNEGLSSKTHTHRDGKRERWHRAVWKGGVLDQLSVCQNMSSRLSLCLSSPLMWIPQWAPRKDHNTAFALWVSLSCSIICESEADREPAMEGEREINYMFP